MRRRLRCRWIPPPRQKWNKVKRLEWHKSESVISFRSLSLFVRFVSIELSELVGFSARMKLNAFYFVERVFQYEFVFFVSFPSLYSWIVSMACTRQSHSDTDALAVLYEMKQKSRKNWPIRMHEHLIRARTVHKFDEASNFFISNLGPIMFAKFIGRRSRCERTDRQTDRQIEWSGLFGIAPNVEHRTMPTKTPRLASRTSVTAIRALIAYSIFAAPRVVYLCIEAWQRCWVWKLEDDYELREFFLFVDFDSKIFPAPNFWRK